MQPRVAIVDGASFVLPYDQGLASGLARRGWQVAFFGSRTRYNENFLDALRSEPGVQVQAEAVSGTVSPRWRGLWAYAWLWAGVWRQRRQLDAVNLQFSVLWPLELPLLWLLRRRFVFTVHNAVPHGFAGRRHGPTRWLAALARRLVFASEATRSDFLRRYGPHHAAKSAVLPHGLLPLAPGLPVQPCTPRPAPEALVFWSTVKPYKGVELFRELARSPRWAAEGLPLEVWGAWDASLHPLRDELRTLGVKITDAYLDTAALQALFARNVLFVLPHRDASQSGALYTLLHHGCQFLCADSGDLGAFVRRFDLTGMMLRQRDTESTLACLQYLRAHSAAVADRFNRAQQQLQWAQALAGAEAAYGVGA
jgi:hypothetical protein